MQLVLKATSPPEVALKDIYRAAWPYCVIDVVGLALVIQFPILATWFKGT